ncbi:helix-turn-helix domain-containing protein [Streptomyces sp. NPDC059695]|uniref:helix-turn-helix domain-containing protein n=1 Tax=Streptomyces sp. NPDC059695 TaxID=3346910 RepID=UPI0036A7C826
MTATAADRTAHTAGGPPGRTRRADDVLALQRAARKGGSDAVLGWLAERSGAEALLIDGTGAVVPSGRRPRYTADRAVLEAVRSGVRELVRRRVGSMALDVHGHRVFLYPLDQPSGPTTPVLVSVAPRSATAGLASLLADAVSTLSLCWKAENAERLCDRAEFAEGRAREAALHLLTHGHIAAARQASGTLQPQLPETIRVWAVEGSPASRGEIARRLRATSPNAWVVPCTRYDGLLIVLAPAPAQVATAGPPPPECAGTATGVCRVGVSDVVALEDAATGYAQAFHALVAARHRTNGSAAFATNPDLVLAIGAAVGDWAEHFLAPLRAHSARRPQDPGSVELLATAASWLSAPSQATEHLGIHRNTLSARLRHIARRLDLDLDRLADQSALALALRALDSPYLTGHTGRTPGAAPEHGTSPRHRLDDLLAQPAVSRWAGTQLQPLTASAQASPLARTLAVWLHHDAHVEATAAALSLSTTAVRKRLARAETLLQRSLLRSPSDRHELWLAHRALCLAPAAPED